MKLRVVTLRSPRLRAREVSCGEVVSSVQAAAAEAGWECEASFFTELDSDSGLDTSLIEPKPKTELPVIDAQAAPLTLPQLSNVLRHREIIRQTATAPAADAPDFTLVLEDDALRTDATPTLLKRFLQAAARNAFKVDLVFAGLPRVTPEGKVAPDSLTLKDADLNDVELLRLQSSFLILPSKESYFLTPAGAKRIWEAWKDKISFRTAVQLSWTIAAKKLRAFYFSTNMFVDGSKVGYYSNACAPNGMLLYNAKYMQVVTLLQKTPRTDAELREADKLVDELAKGLRNPNIIHQRGLIAFLRGDYPRAHATLQEAVDLALADGACLNHMSDLLNNAINVCRFVQDDVEKLE